MNIPDINTANVLIAFSALLVPYGVMWSIHKAIQLMGR